jgi:TolB protein
MGIAPSQPISGKPVAASDVAINPLPTTFVQDFSNANYPHTPATGLSAAIYHNEGTIGRPIAANYYSWAHDPSAFNDIGAFCCSFLTPGSTAVAVAVQFTLSPGDKNVYTITDFSFAPSWFGWINYGYQIQIKLTAHFDIYDTDGNLIYAGSECDISSCWNVQGLHVSGAKSIILTETATVESYGVYLLEPLIMGMTVHTAAVINGPIAFGSDRIGGNQIYVMNPDGTNLYNLNFGYDIDNKIPNPTFAAIKYSYPAWSPDGTKMAFVATIGNSGGVYILDLTNATVNAIPNTASPSHPSWSPDGKQITFESNGPTKNDIYIVNIDGSGLKNLTQSATQANGQPSNDNSPSWSPDGKNITFISNREGKPDLFLMNVDGSSVQHVALGGNLATIADPAWSFDGTNLLFTGDGNLYSWNRASGQTTLSLTNSPGASNGQGVYSPDGTKIAFSTNRVPQSEIYVMNPDGTIPKNITNNPNSNYRPSWSIQPSANLIPPSQTIPIPHEGKCQFHLKQPDGNTSSGIPLRESPTITAPILDTIPWGAGNPFIPTPLTAKYSLVIQGNLWYEVHYGVNPGNDGWIAATTDGVSKVDKTDCPLPTPYPSTWSGVVDIQMAQIPGKCDINTYLKSEPPQLVLARAVYGEAAIYSSADVVFSDAVNVSWIIRMDAFLGLPNYGAVSVAGRSVTTTDEILQPKQIVAITQLADDLPKAGCDPSSLSPGTSRKMVYPENTVSKAELYELWRVYQDVARMYNAPWTTMSTLIVQHSDQYKGYPAQPCNTKNYARPGAGYSWASTQPYPPQFQILYQDPKFGKNQSTFGCYQDVYHLDDLFWAALQGQSNANDLTQQQAQAAITSNKFPKEFCVAVLQNPDFPTDKYPLAQLIGKDGKPWPPGQVSCDKH